MEQKETARFFTPITDINLPELEPYRQTSEVQLLRWNEPDPGIFIAESAKVIERAFDAGYEPLSMLVATEQLNGESGALIEKMCDRSAAGNAFPIYAASVELLKNIRGFNLTRGLMCAMRRAALPAPEQLCREFSRIAVLEDIENPTNVGAIFRSAAALGIDAVLLTGGCADPLYRRASRVSMGTVFQIPWTFLETVGTADAPRPASEVPGTADAPRPASEVPGTDQVLERSGGKKQTDYVCRLHAMGFKTAAMALEEDSVSIRDERIHAEEKLAIVLGNEGNGLSAQTIQSSDYTIMIPMSHGVDSLNVAAASAVAFWELGNGEKR